MPVQQRSKWTTAQYDIMPGACCPTQPVSLQGVTANFLTCHAKGCTLQTDRCGCGHRVQSEGLAFRITWTNVPSHGRAAVVLAGGSARFSQGQVKLGTLRARGAIRQRYCIPAGLMVPRFAQTCRAPSIRGCVWRPPWRAHVGKLSGVACLCVDVQLRRCIADAPTGSDCCIGLPAAFCASAQAG